MNKILRLGFLIGLMLSAARFSSAASIAVGDWVHFNGSSGTLGGGAFTLTDVTDSAVADFLTFCVQESQTVDYTHDFRVGSITNYADDAAGPDPIDAKTSWIMSNFSRGLLGAYGANDIQWAIWQLEGEQVGSWGNSDALIQMAQLAVVGGWTNDGVQVLNLFWADGTPAQDQLVYTGTAAVPEPATFVLLGSGLLVLVQTRRRTRKSLAASLS